MDDPNSVGSGHIGVHADDVLPRRSSPDNIGRQRHRGGAAGDAGDAGIEQAVFCAVRGLSERYVFEV